MLKIEPFARAAWSLPVLLLGIGCSSEAEEELSNDQTAEDEVVEVVNDESGTLPVGIWDGPVDQVDSQGDAPLFVRTRMVLTEQSMMVTVQGYKDRELQNRFFRYDVSGPLEWVGQSAAVEGALEANLEGEVAYLTLDEASDADKALLGISGCEATADVPAEASGPCASPLVAAFSCAQKSLIKRKDAGLRLSEATLDSCDARPTDLSTAVWQPSTMELSPETPVGYVLIRDMVGEDNYAGLDGVLAHLDAEATRREDTHMLRAQGLAHFWKFVEFPRAIAAGADPEQQQFHLQEQIRLHSEAMADPNYDPKLDSWLGGVLLQVGVAVDNPEWVAQGGALLDKGLESYLEFNGFSVGSIEMQKPADENYRAGEVFLDILSSCTQGQLDRENPDLTPFNTQEWRDKQPKACYNGDHAPYGNQGFMVVAGDAVLKGGDVEVARVLYENARNLSGWETWPFQALIDERLSDDLDARAAKLRDDDPSNDPDFGADMPCAGCHQASSW